MRRAKFDSINVVPFIDIMLVLLVIVLTTASFVQTGLIKVDLPKASSQFEQKPKKELPIAIKADGKIYFNNLEIKATEVERKLLVFEKDTPIYLSCDKNAQFNHFVFILDILKNNGYENLGIVTEQL